MIRVTLTANLQKYYPERSFSIDAATLRELLQKMDGVRPHFSRYLLEDDGSIRRHVNFFVNGELVRDKKNLDFRLPENADVHLMQALSGG